ncbi:MAG: hypothetical protein MJZ15_02420 [Bacteroidales bacterium]|nr:hypothetical protein [Bacteroidales bacterium]
MWNFSDLEVGTIAKITDLGDLAIGGTRVKPVVVDENSKNIDGMSFTKRLKFPGPGSAQGRFVKVHVDGSCSLTVYGMASNARDGVRAMILSKGDLKNVLTNSFLSNDGSWISKDTYKYEGGSTDLFLYSETGGFNLYAIRID